MGMGDTPEETLKSVLAVAQSIIQLPFPIMPRRLFSALVRALLGILALLSVALLLGLWGVLSWGDWPDTGGVVSFALLLLPLAVLLEFFQAIFAVLVGLWTRSVHLSW